MQQWTYVPYAPASSLSVLELPEHLRSVWWGLARELFRAKIVVACAFADESFDDCFDLVLFRLDRDSMRRRVVLPCENPGRIEPVDAYDRLDHSHGRGPRPPLDAFAQHVRVYSQTSHRDLEGRGVVSAHESA